MPKRKIKQARRKFLRLFYKYIFIFMHFSALPMH